MKIAINKLRAMIEKKFLLNKITTAQARFATAMYLDGELQGKKSHGLIALKSFLKKGEKLKNSVKILKRTSATIFLDAQSSSGILVGFDLVSSLIPMARRTGVAVGFIKNMRTWLRPGEIARLIAKKNMIGVVLNNGGAPMISPPGGLEPVLGTNPIGIAVPTLREPMTIDMATSARAWREVALSVLLHKPLPKNIFLDKNGNFTQKPDSAMSVIPFGNYKGFSLALFIELVAMMTGSQKSLLKNKDVNKSANRGGMILVIDPRVCMSLTKFKKQNSALLQKIRKSKRRNSSQAILIPGDRAQKNKKIALHNKNILIEEELLNLLK